MSWYNEAFLAAGTAFLCAALVLTGMGVTRHSKYSLRQRLGQWRSRRKRIRGETYYLITRGSISREEEGQRKIYLVGDLIGLTDKDARGFGEDNISGPIDMKAWKRINAKKKKDTGGPR